MHRSFGLRRTSPSPFHIIITKKYPPLKHLLHIIIVLLLALAAVSCSTKKNTASTRRWQSFVTRYNVYFNADQAYIEGRQAQDKGLKENFTERLPLFGVGYEKQRSLGKSNFETAITKCEKAIQLHSIKKKPVVDGSKSKDAKTKAYLSRREFNPFLKNAWMLMGKAQFQKGEFAEAAATFSYITRYYAPEPDVVAEARIWLARCYAELDWFYDAEDVIQRLDRDSMPSSLKAERDLTMADYLIRQERLNDALPYLERVVKKEKGKARKAREYYLLAQTYMALDRKKDAYKAFAKCIKQSPAYEMSFHARIMQTEALTTSANARSMIKRLKRMAKNDNNKDYLDQVYYAIGNIYMQQRDTLQAISAYEKGRKDATQKGPETAILLLRLGGIYWEQRRFDKAQPCYTEAIGLLDKTHDQYKEITHRSKVLDALVPPTSAIYLQDSLQWLASVDEDTRNEAIDRVIKELKKKEDEEKKARRDSAADARDKNNPQGSRNNDNMGNLGGANAAAAGGSKEWYFYNAQLVMQGKQSFQKQWGNRKNEDDWRRNNRTVLASNTIEEVDYEKEDSIAAVKESLRDSLLATGMSEKEVKRWMRDHEDGNDEADDEEDGKKKELPPEEDPHQREYYLAQIPFSPEAKATSDSIIRESLFEAGVIEKDKLEDLPLAAETFGRLERQFPDFLKMDEATYHQFLLYSRWAELDTRDSLPAQAQQHRAKAEVYRERMRTQYPDYAMTPVITDPDFEYNSRYGRELEDSLYTLTYDAYRRGDNMTVERHYKTSTDKFPKGANRPKFIFIHALSQIGTAPTDSISKELRELVQEFPKSDVAEMAGMIVKGLESGRTIGSGNFDLGSLWSRRTAQTEGAEGAPEDRALSPDRDVPFVFLIAYETDADIYGDQAAKGGGKKAAANKTDDRLLYDLARFNFSTFVFRGFDISKERQQDITQFRVSGFRNYDDVHNYAQHIFRDDHLGPVLRRARIELISEPNLRKLGTIYSFDEYRHFYDSCFAPLKINADLPLSFGPNDADIDIDEGTPEPGIIYSPGGRPLSQDKIRPANSGTTTPEEPARSITDENGDPILEETEAVGGKAGEDYGDADDEEGARPSTKADDYADDDEGEAASRPATKADDYSVDDEGAEPTTPARKDNDYAVDDDDAGAKTPVTKEDSYVDDDDEFEFKTPKKNDDDFILDDDATPASKPKNNDDDYILDDDAAPTKTSSSSDDDYILDDDTAPAKTQAKKDDDTYVDDDDEFDLKPAKKDDDTEVYDE